MSEPQNRNFFKLRVVFTIHRAVNGRKYHNFSDTFQLPVNRLTCYSREEQQSCMTLRGWTSFPPSMS